MSITVVIATFNRHAQLVKLLSRLCGQRVLPDQVVVVDDCSDSPVALENERYPFDVSLVRLQSNSGPAAARDAGCRVTTSTYLTFIDDDDEPEDHWISDFSAAAIGHPAVVFCALGDETGRQQEPEWVRQRAGRYMAGTFMLRADVYKAVGGYEAKLRFGENGDLGLRVERWLQETGEATRHTGRIGIRYHRSADGLSHDHRAVALAARRQFECEAAQQRPRKAVLLRHARIAAYASGRSGDASHLLWAARQLVRVHRYGWAGLAYLVTVLMRCPFWFLARRFG